MPHNMSFKIVTGTGFLLLNTISHNLVMLQCQLCRISAVVTILKANYARFIKHIPNNI